MFTRKTFLLLISIMPVVLSSCVSSSMNTDNSYINTRKRYVLLTKRLIALKKSGKTADMKKFFEQLEKKKCDVEIELPGESTIEPVDIYNDRKNAVVVVGQLYMCGKCSKPHTMAASGFFANDSGIVVTNYHVVNNPKAFAMGVMTYDGEVLPVKKILAANKADDVAVIQVETKKKTPYLKIQSNINVGSDVWVISHPSKNFFMFTEGMVSALFERDLSATQSVKRLLITADFGGGSSGAPVFNDKGEVVGIVTSTQSIQATKCKQKYAQMVMKNCVPAESIIKLFK